MEKNMTTKEMPKYTCHKTVHALKISEVKRGSPRGQDDDGSLLLVPELSEYSPVWVSAVFAKKHNPLAGGYFVVYNDGYTSFSPSDAFEEGYTIHG